MINNNKIIKACIYFVLILSSYYVFAQYDADHKKIEAKIDQFLTYFSGNNPGAVVVVIKNGELVFNKAYGLSNIETGKKMQVDHVFNLAELSKALNVIAVFKLVERNKLSLDDNLTSIFHDFPEYGNKVKVRNLLNHTSGLSSFDSKVISSNDEVYNYLKQQNGLLFEPGTKQDFCNSDYALLIKIIEKVSRKSYSKYMHKYIFRKLKLENTFIAGEERQIKLADPHFHDDSVYHINNVTNNILGTQGIYSNSEDMAKLYKALDTDDLLTQESLYQMFTMQKLDFGNKQSYYKYGWFVMEKNGVNYNWHGASSCGYSNLILNIPDLKTVVLIMSNRDDAYDFLKLAIEIAKLYNKYLYL